MILIKKITILAIAKDISEFFVSELKNIFGDIIEVEYRHMEMEPVPPIYDTDLILYTDPEILNNLIYTIKCDAPTLMMKRTITRQALRKIKEIPSGKKVLVTNINQYMANETMALIYQLGVTDLELYPYYEEKEDYPEDIEYIIIPEDEPYDFLSNIEAKNILIGDRVFDISNILDILSILRVDNQRSEEIIKKYLLKVPTFWYGFEYAWQNRRVLLNQYKLLLDEIGSGVIVTDGDERIELINNKAEEILNIKKEPWQGKRIDKLAKNNFELDFLLTNEEKSEELLKYHGRDLVFSLKKVKFSGDFYGKVIIFRLYNEMVEVQQKIHKKIVGKGHQSDYSFSDIVGKDPRINEARRISRKISLSNSTVLLLGDSGTGKEMFAGAIHNYSHRSSKPFVAVNCATLPENLLESELFGYEEGAFTGAKKGGKIGLFERADKGTLFLDEIGDMPLNLQARLLRVLEEKEIMRVGGNSVISVDVRVIAATNKNLLKQVKEGDFRKDLFYRLNVFQVNLPSLAERKKDIPLLIEHFLKKQNNDRELVKDFEVFYKNYSWPGNARELKNVLEYITTVFSGELSFAKLPAYLKKKKFYSQKEKEIEMLLLKILFYRSEANKNTGRRSLTNVFTKVFFKISEMETRELLHSLEDKEFVEIKKGRAGTVITEKGVEKLKEENYLEKDKEIFLI
ncbi:MAG: sigma 54-interacting transcriptional regulator [Bacillota bacterium]